MAWFIPNEKCITVCFNGGALDGGETIVSRDWCYNVIKKDSRGRFVRRVLVAPGRYHWYASEDRIKIRLLKRITIRLQATEAINAS